jgi:hypothetical protein
MIPLCRAVGPPAETLIAARKSRDAREGVLSRDSDAQGDNLDFFTTYLITNLYDKERKRNLSIGSVRRLNFLQVKF